MTARAVQQEEKCSERFFKDVGGISFRYHHCVDCAWVHGKQHFSRSLYRKSRSELVREADAICRIVLEEYMDDAKRPVAKEKLFAIVRQYEALLQLCFIDPSLGIRSFYDEKMHQNGRRAKNSMLRPLQKTLFLKPISNTAMLTTF